MYLLNIDIQVHGVVEYWIFYLVIDIFLFHGYCGYSYCHIYTQKKGISGHKKYFAPQKKNS